MSELMYLPTVEYLSFADMVEQGLGYRKKWVVIVKNENVGDKMTFHYYTGEELVDLPFAVSSPGPAIPSGGATNQVLAKKSGSDFDYYWKTDEVGAGGGGDGDFLLLSDDAGDYLLLT